MPITQLSSIANTIQLTIASAERVFELLDEPEEPADGAGARRWPTPRGEVQFDRRRFSYKPDVPLIEDMSHRRRARADGRHRRPHRRRQDDAGQPADAVLRRQRRRDPRRRRRHPRPDARRRCAGCSAWCCRTRGCSRARIRDNIAYGREGASEEAIVQAAKAAQADHFIRTLPENYDTRDQRRSDQPVAGAEAAADDRARVPRRSGDPDPRRGDEQRRHAHRSADPEGDGAS